MSELITTRTTQLAWDVLEANEGKSEDRASLVIHCGDQAEVVQLSGAHDSVVLGRTTPADVCIPSASLSRQHARFTLHEGALQVEDLQSLNGTLRDGIRIERATLQAGDRVALGDVTVHVCMSLSAATAHAARGETRGVETAPLGRGNAPRARAGTGADAARDDVVIESPAMQRLYALAAKLAETDVSVLIVGETGTGKEHLAQALHRGGPRKACPFRVVNCGAIPDGLAESILFGHERGAFTGANQARAGVFEDAGDGTVFLDEIGELPLATQAKLLRVLETREVTRVGGQRTIALGMRVVAATHCDLERMVLDKSFRQDLLYRLNTVCLQVPPLRERCEEIGPLARRFARLACDAWSLPPCEIDAPAMEALERFAWPGNIRHLRNTIERAALLCRAGRITTSDLPESVRAAPRAPAPMANITAAATVVAEPPGPSVGGGVPFKEQVQALEARLIGEALAQTGGNQRAAAKLLRMPRRTLAYKIRTLGLGHGGAGDD